MFELKVVFDTLEELQEFLNGHSEKEAIIDKEERHSTKKPNDTEQNILIKLIGNV